MQRNAKTNSNVDSLIEDIKGLAGKMQKLTHIAESQFATEVESIIKEKSRDSSRIERCLDGLIGFCFDDNMLTLYKKLCRYYYDINPDATKSYAYAYREMWGVGVGG